MKVLVIDHQADQVSSFHEELTKHGFTVHVTQEGKDGIAEAFSFTPDIILLGQMLPHMSGIDILKVLKNNELTKNIPVIILTHFATKELIGQAMELGASDYIVKDTISGPDLIEKINTIIQASHGGTGWQAGDANELF